MNQWGGKMVAKGPFKRTVHLLEQDFDKKKLAASIIFYVYTL